MQELSEGMTHKESLGIEKRLNGYFGETLYASGFARTMVKLASQVTIDDLYEVVASDLIKVFRADFAVMIRMRSDDEIEGTLWTDESDIQLDDVLTDEVRAMITDVFGFNLPVSEKASLKEVVHIMYLPIGSEGKNNRILMVGHRSENDIPDYLFTDYVRLSDVLACLQTRIDSISGYLDKSQQLAESEEKRFELEERLQETKERESRFLENLSHEIRTPMTAILGFTELLIMSPGRSEMEWRNHMNVIRRNGKQLLDLINDILDLAKIETGDFIINKLDCSPKEIVSDVMNATRLLAEEKGLSLETAFAFPTPNTINTDPVRLRQILLSLVKHAINVTMRGGVRITTSSRFAEGESSRMEFIVSDTRTYDEIGKTSDIFEPFSSHPTVTSNKAGTDGLSLPISKRLATVLGGDIKLGEDKQRGCSITVTIDAGEIVEENEVEVVQHEQTLDPVRPVQSQRLVGNILLVEDAHDTQMLIMIILKDAGMDVTLAEDGVVAVEKALEAHKAGEPFDVILMDIQLPNMDGLEATTRLRENGVEGPIIALTARSLTGDKEKCIEAGCTDYIAKPVYRAELLASLTRYLGQTSVSLNLLGESEGRRAAVDQRLN